jgi:hypothetical protein
MDEMNIGTLIVVGVVSGAVALGFKIIWDWLKNRKIDDGGGCQMKKDTAKAALFDTQRMVRDLSQKDQNGVPLAFVPRDMADNITVVKDQSTQQTLILGQIRDELKKQNGRH